MKKCLVIIPTYNEIQNVADIIKAVLSKDPSFEVLIVDDGSPDGTADVVKKMMAQDPRIHIVEREGKLGLGTAYIAGFEYGLERDFDYLFEMDADFSHNPDDLVRLKAACDAGADVAIGSRYTAGGGVKDWSAYRLFLSKAASIYVRLITWMSVKDSTAGFKCYKAKVLRTIPLDKIRSIGYAFQIEMKYAAYRNGFRIVEVPIVFKDREKGTSKMDSSIISEAIKGVIAMRFKAAKGYYQGRA